MNYMPLVQGKVTSNFASKNKTKLKNLMKSQSKDPEKLKQTIVNL